MMSYAIYRTSGLVLRTRDSGESDRILWILTRELGLILAAAKGIRELKSKLRYGLQEHDFSDCEFIRGKEMWRITNAEKTVFLRNIPKNQHKSAAFSRVGTLLLRFLAGEARDAAFFDHFLRIASFLDEEDLHTDEIAVWEGLAAFAIVRDLGYGGGESAKIIDKSGMSWDRLWFDRLSGSRKVFVQDVNKAIRESHL
ncbi:DNA repair protein RecO [bacterium]|nr:DNA repair protein RecO [bacterium]